MLFQYPSISQVLNSKKPCCHPAKASSHHQVCLWWPKGDPEQGRISKATQKTRDVNRNCNDAAVTPLPLFQVDQILESTCQLSVTHSCRETWQIFHLRRGQNGPNRGARHATALCPTPTMPLTADPPGIGQRARQSPRKWISNAEKPTNWSTNRTFSMSGRLPLPLPLGSWKKHKTNMVFAILYS